jgi:competence ComEA-like helix-hairpin-helix protein
MLNLNQASSEELQEIKGIGKVTAERIVNYRQEKGGFSNLDELTEVPGIGSKSLDQIKGNLAVEDVQVDKKAEDLIKIEFKPAKHGLGELGEVHLVGDMNDWDPADKSYALKKQPDGTWADTFALEPGTEYKFMYDSVSWEANQYIGGEYGTNLVIKG